MPKAKAHPGQLGFTFEAPVAPSRPAALAGMEARICSTVGTLLNSDSRPREIIAAEMSVLLAEEISPRMLDAYASPARAEHKVPMSRFLALIVVTGRHDLLDPLMREIGAAVLVGAEVMTARLGQIDQTIAQLTEERSKLAAIAPLIRGDSFK